MKDTDKITMSQLKRLIKENVGEVEFSEMTEDSGCDYGKYLDFGYKLLMFGVEAHIWHLNCTSNSAHLALKELYEACDDFADKLLEATLSITGGNIENKSGNPDYEFGNLVYDSESAVAKIRALIYEAQDLIDASVQARDGDVGIENILTDFCETCNSVIYKLKRLN